MSKGAGLYGENDTHSVVDFGHTIQKMCYCKAEHIPAFVEWTSALYDAGCIGYQYSKISFDSSTSIMTTVRPKVIGTSVSDLHSYSDYFVGMWNRFADQLIHAGDLFDQRGYGYIHIEPKELQNYIVDHDGRIHAIDLETSFMVVSDQRMFRKYTTNMQVLMMQELQRYVILRSIEQRPVDLKALFS